MWTLIVVTEKWICFFAELSADQLFDSLKSSETKRPTTTKKPRSTYSFKDSVDEDDDDADDASSGSDYKPSPKAKSKIFC